MGYRVHFLTFSKLSEGRLESSLRQRGEFGDTFFSDPQVFVSNESWSGVCVGKRSEISEQFEDLISAMKAPSIWITTNEVDDWRIKVHDGAGDLAELHIPWVNVDPEEHEEEGGEEVLYEIRANSLPADLQEQIGGLDTGEAWRAFFDHAQRALTEALEKASIGFDAEKLARLFSEEAFGEVSDYEASQLGYFINAVLGVGFDLSPAED